VCITPGLFFPPHFRIWTIFSSFFLEFHFWEVLIDIATLVLCGKLIEPLWGQIEMLTFFGVVNISVGIAASAFYLFLYSFLFNPELLFSIRIHGLSGYIAAVTVSVKQVIPDQVVFRTPITKITNRNVPLLLLLVAVLLYVVGLLEGTYPVMFGFGLVASWVYLRFYQHHSNGSKGDMADSFAFAT
jgi:membrane associated rhomboid family serine protease